MNKRIRELAEQCYITYRNGHGGYTEQFDEEKFAELIIKRCVQTLIDNTPVRCTNEVTEEDWDKGYDRAMKDCVHHIQEHFGIEQ